MSLATTAQTQITNEVVNLDNLRVDHSYQRTTDEGRVRKWPSAAARR